MTAQRRPPGVFKTMNYYANLLGDIYETAPKAVIAAVAVSMLTNGGNELDTAGDRFIEEWQILHENGIVPQRPPKWATDQITKAKSDQT